ncbi:MAG: hypothetical protein V9G10_04140 [Candidatus Nanopelagicales bacterium]
MTWPLGVQDQSLPALLYVTPTGSVSSMVNGPMLGSGPLFVTSIRHTKSVPGTTSSAPTFHVFG